MTPYQLKLCIEEYNERKKLEDEEKLILTYLGAYWNRVKRMPNIKNILNKTKPKKMTDEEMLKQVERINAALGGTVKGVK